MINIHRVKNSNLNQDEKVEIIFKSSNSIDADEKTPFITNKNKEFFAANLNKYQIKRNNSLPMMVFNKGNNPLDLNSSDSTVSSLRLNSYDEHKSSHISDKFKKKKIKFETKLDLKTVLKETHSQQQLSSKKFKFIVLWPHEDSSNESSLRKVSYI